MAARIPLTRQRVATAALAFIGEHGEAALSMRKLGAELGVEAMSLYNHVANKDDLLDAVSELLYGQVLERLGDEGEDSWQDELRELAHRFREVAHENSNALGVLFDRATPAPVKQRFLLRCYSIFTRAGFDTKEAAVAFDISASWVLGAIRQEMGLMADLAEIGGVVRRDELPEELRAVVDFTDACLAWTPDQRFDYGLETVLAGLEWRLSHAS